MSHHIQESGGIVNEKEPTKVFEDNSTVSECDICVTFEEKAKSTIFRGRLRQCTLFSRHGFYPKGFFHDQVFNEALRNTSLDNQGGVL